MVNYVARTAFHGSLVPAVGCDIGGGNELVAIDLRNTRLFAFLAPLSLRMDLLVVSHRTPASSFICFFSHID